MVKLFIIHIGFPKTGTTSIQIFCRRNRDLLQDQGIFYPKLSVRNANMDQINHTAFMECLLTNPPKRLAVNQTRAREAVGRTLDNFRSSLASTVLLSHEIISQRKDIDFSLLRTFVGGDRLLIVALVRTFDEWLESLYAEGVRSGLQIARPFSKSHLSRFDNLRFITKLRRFREELPRAQFAVLDFDKLRSGGLIASVLRCAGLTEESLLREADAFQARNVSRPMSDVLFVAYSSVVLNDGPAAHRVSSILDKVRQRAELRPDPVCLIPFDLRSEARESYRADLPSIASEFGVDIDDPGPVRDLYTDKRRFLNREEYDILIDLVEPSMDKSEIIRLRSGYQEAIEAMS